MNKRPLSALISTTEPAWPLLQQWIEEAQNQVEVIPVVKNKSEEALLFLQVTARSPMGAIALQTGGILVDHGWIRVLGASSERVKHGILAWNEPDGLITAPLKGALIIAHDVVGGFFAINGGAFVGQTGNVFYWAPDTLNWEDLKFSYTNFIIWAFQGDLATFYKSARWPDWEKDVAALTGDDGLSIWPPLWAVGPGIQERSRRTVSMHELWHFQQDMAANVKALPPGTAIRLTFSGKPVDLQKS